MSLEPNDIKDIVLNTDKPCIIKNLNLNWRCLQSMNLSEWCSHLNNSFENGILFELSTIKHNQYPQWERYRKSYKMTMEEFTNKFNSCQCEQQSATFSYKDLNILPKECREGVSFDCLGFPSVEYVNFWFGSKFAHTSGHYDTYGCNIVVQVYGRKSWLLFPPLEHLSPTRVPYEESSVYCKENFYSPKCLDQFKDIKEPHHITLQPGQVLLIPRHWWHYAENLETSLSINTWIPLDVDVHSQIDECIVQTQLSQIARDLPVELRSAILNPNEIETPSNNHLPEQLNLLKSLMSVGHNTQQKRLKLNHFPSNYLSSDELGQLLHKCKNYVEPLGWISKDKFFDILNRNLERFDATIGDGIDGTDEYKTLSAFINSICKPDVVQMVKANLLKEMSF